MWKKNKIKKSCNFIWAVYQAVLLSMRRLLLSSFRVEIILLQFHAKYSFLSHIFLSLILHFLSYQLFKLFELSLFSICFPFQFQSSCKLSNNFFQFFSVTKLFIMLWHRMTRRAFRQKKNLTKTDGRKFEICGT